jgi:hypothetical protein
MSLDIDSFDFDALDQSDFNRVNKGGLYHMTVQNVDDQDVKITADFEVLNGTDPEQVRRGFREFYTSNDKDFNVRRLCLFAIACGLTTRERLKAAQKNAGGEFVPETFYKDAGIHWEDAAGRDVCAEVEMHEYNGNTNPRIKGLNIWPPTDPKARDVPRGDAPAATAGDDDMFRDL